LIKEGRKTKVRINTKRKTQIESNTSLNIEKLK